MKKRTLIAINVDNVVDVITNSSSELFILKGETKDIVTEMIENIYPDFRNEYEEVKDVNELTNDELNHFMSYHCSPHMWPASKSQHPLLKGFSFDDLYEPERDYRTGEVKPPSWNGEIQYRLRSNGGSKWGGDFVTDENRERVIESIKKTVGNFFLYSIDDNPDWDKQEELMGIGTRYHLG